MLAPLDIFLVTDAGGLVWKGAAENFEVAKLNVQKLMESTRGDYIVYSQPTGNKTILKADGSVIYPDQVNSTAIQSRSALA